MRHLIDRAAGAAPDTDFLIDPAGGQSVTFADLQHRAHGLARELSAAGLAPGDKVAFLTDNSVYAAVLFLGSMYGGFVAVPLNVRAGETQLAYTLGHSDARLLFVEAAYADLATAITSSASSAARTVAFDGKSLPPLHELPAGAAPATSVRPEDPALLMYTSGSTGLPKAAVHTHASIAAHGRNSVEAHKLTSADRSLLVLPLYHINAECVTLTPTLTAMGSVVIPRQFLVSDFWDLIETWRCTWSAIVPTIVAQLIDWKDPKAGQRAAAFERIRFLRSSSAPLSPSLQQEFIAKFGLPLIQAMGSSEAGNIFSNPVPPGVSKLGSPGLPWGFELKIANADGTALRQGEPGEILLRGDGMMQGYYRDPEATAAALDPDGWFHTGDLAYLDEDGYLFIVGRSKELVIKAGVNISPKQIDEVLEAHPAVLEAAAVGVPDEYLGEDLVAFAVLRGGAVPDEAGILRFCESRLGQFKTPTRLFFVDDLPKGPSGKIQRLGLVDRAKQQRAAGEAPASVGACSVAPASAADAETFLAQLWSTLLACEIPDRDSNFFGLGGHSLKALQCLAAVRERFQVALSLKDFFENPTLSLLSAVISSRSAPATRGGAAGAESEAAQVRIPPRGGATAPLTMNQLRIWFMDELSGGAPVFNESDAARLLGPLDVGLLQQAFDLVVARHEILRVTTRVMGDDVEVSELAGWRLKLKVIDLAETSSDRREAELARLLVDEPRIQFDLARQPGVRATLVKLGPQEHALIVMMHHIICDRGSMHVLWGELAAAYNALSEGRAPDLPALRIQFGDYAEWTRQHVDEVTLSRDLAYWEEQLAGAPPVLHLPADNPRPAQVTYSGARKRYDAPAELSAAVQDFCRRAGATPFIVFAAAVDALLFRYTGQDDISVAVPLSQRKRAELQPLVGFLVHTHVLRTRLDSEMTFGELLTAVQLHMIEIHEHSHPTFDQVVNRVRPRRDLGYSPLAQVMLNWRSSDQLLASANLSGLKLEPLLSESGTSKYDITLILEQFGDQMKLEVEYNTQLFDESRIDRMVGHLATLVESALRDPGQRLSELTLLTAEERRQLLVQWNTFEPDDVAS